MESPQQRGFADEQADRGRSEVVALPDAQHYDANRLSKAAKEVSSMTEMTRMRTGEAHFWPSVSIGAQQSSFVSYGTAWDARAAPCYSEATVSIGPQQAVNTAALPAKGRKRPFPGPFPDVRTDQGYAAVSVDQSALVAQLSVRDTVECEEEEYESRLLINPEASHLGNATVSTPGQAAIRPSKGQRVLPTQHPRSHSHRSWPADHDPAAKAALFAESTQDIEKYWDDHNPPQHPIRKDLDIEE